MNVSEILLSAARDIEETLPHIKRENLHENLKKIANQLCFLSALYAIEEAATHPVESNVIAFVKRKTKKDNPL